MLKWLEIETYYGYILHMRHERGKISKVTTEHTVGMLEIFDRTWVDLPVVGLGWSSLLMPKEPSMSICGVDDIDITPG